MATSSAVNPQILAKATILRQLGVKPGDGLPSWARQNAYEHLGPAKLIDRNQLAAGVDPQSAVTDQYGWYEGGLGAFTPKLQGNGDSQGFGGGASDETINQWLQSGNSVMEANQGQANVRWIQDKDGKVVGKPQLQTIDDSAFWTAAQLASSVVGGAVGGNAGGALVGAANAAGNAGVETGNFSSMLKAALLAAGTSYVGNAASAASGLTGAAGSAVSGAVGSGITAAAKGGNLSETLKAAIIGAAPGATGAALNDNKALSPVLAGLVKNIVGSAVNKRAPSTSPGSIAALLSTMIPKQSGG